ncbi:conserved hypothetical protein [Candidatus Terasakiella magnetica]|nr:conserved hypothetical protein [Candidatus Terasakiella magnetica]
MSGFEQFIPLATSMAGTVMKTSQKSDAAQAALDAQAEDAARQTQLLQMQQAQRDEQQSNLLDQAAASERAQMAAMGIGGDGGSADAIIGGLTEQTANRIAANDRMTALRVPVVRPNLLGRKADSLAPVTEGLNVMTSFFGATDNGGGGFMD